MNPAAPSAPRANLASEMALPHRAQSSAPRHPSLPHPGRAAASGERGPRGRGLGFSEARREWKCSETHLSIGKGAAGPRGAGWGDAGTTVPGRLL